MRLSQFMHNDCVPLYSVRFLSTPDLSDKKYVFDLMYRDTILLSDGLEYDSIEECFNAFTAFVIKLDKHEIVNAFVQ